MNIISLQVWLPLNGNLNNYGIGDLTTASVQSGVVVDNNGKIGKCYSFDGTSITVPKLFNTNISEFSLCAWVKLLDGYELNNGCHLISVDNDLRICVSKDGHAIAFIANNASIITGSALNYSNLNSNRWYHFAITFKDGIVSYYIDGMKDSETNIGIEQLKNIGNKSYCIGSYGSESSKSCINDYRLYSHCLSPLEVKQISQGLVCHYKLSGCGGENLLINSGNYTINSPLTVSSSAKDGYNQSINLYASLEAGTTYTLSAKQDGTWSSGHNTGGVDYTKKYNSLWLYLKDGTSYNFLNMTNGYANFTPTKSGTYYIRTNTYSDGTNKVTVNYWDIKLEEGSKPTPWCPNPSDALYSALGYNDEIEYDCSGYGNNGTKVGDITWSGDSARYSGSYYFDSKSHYKIPCPLVSPQEFSCSFWIKPISCGGYAIISSNYNNPSSGFWLAVNCEGSGLWFYNGSYARSNKGLLSLNAWYHVCFVFNKGIITWYQNGEVAGTTDLSSRTTTLGIQDYISIGNSFTGTTWNTNYSGNISDFRIYSTILSAEDVKSLYNVSASIDKTGVLSAYEFVEEV